MFYFLSLLSGALISFSVLFNGMLSDHHGIHSATVVIHIAGLILITAIVLITRARPFAKRYKWYLYLGGILGVFTVLSNNIAFGRISVSALLALLLFGQSLAGLVIDQTGWLGMNKYPFNKKKLAGLLLTLCGIAVMIDRFDVLAVAVSFVAGINIVIARTLNGKLAEASSVRVSTFFNYFMGLAFSIPILLLFGPNGDGFSLTAFISGFSLSFDGSATGGSAAYMYLGGWAGVGIILIANYTVTKVSAFYLSLLMFIGQVFTGVLIDSLIDQAISPRIVIGGVLVSVGLCVDLLLNRKKEA